MRIFKCFMTVTIVTALFFTGAFVWADGEVSVEKGDCTVTDKDGNEQKMDIYIYGDMTLTEVKAGGQTVKTIIDNKNKKVLMVMDNAKMCMTQPYSAPAVAEGNTKGKTEMKNPDGSGYSCDWTSDKKPASFFKCPAGYKSM